MSQTVPLDRSAAPVDFVSIPEHLADASVVVGHGGQGLNLYRLRASRGDGPVVLFGHGCGFAAGAYLALLERLTDAAEIFAYDARGHGGSEASASDLSIFGPDEHALDLAAVARAVTTRTAGRPLYFVGHSMSAAAMVRLGTHQPAAFASVPWRAAILFEPPIFPSEDLPEYARVLHPDRAMRLRSRGRRRDWPTRQAFVEALTGRSLFGHIAPDTIAAYARATLRSSGSGFTLACPPEIEEATYGAFANGSTFAALGRFPRELPLRYVAGLPANPAEAFWPTWFGPTIAERLRCGGQANRRLQLLPGRSHLMVLEDPAAGAEAIHSLITSH